jgi:hypothetical protein
MNKNRIRGLRWLVRLGLDEAHDELQLAVDGRKPIASSGMQFLTTIVSRSSRNRGRMTLSLRGSVGPQPD